jgi:HSP20 family protein
MIANNLAAGTGRIEMDSPRQALDGIYYTRFDTYETEDELVFRCPMPWVRLIQVETRLDHGELIIQGKVRFETQESSPENPSKPYCFFRSFPIRQEVEVDRMTTFFKDGVLTVRLPKADVAQTSEI